MKQELIFLKLGGSLITNKAKPFTVEQILLDRISGEIVQFLQTTQNTQLVIGHGSGSFGHTSAAKFKTRDGVRNNEQWKGYQKVCADARRLNQIVMSSLIQAGLPAISFPPSTQIITADHNIHKWDIYQIQIALEHNLVPVVFGDTVIDAIIGGTILSTEELFIYLANSLRPSRILLAGIEEGVWTGFPDRTHLVRKITPEIIDEIQMTLGGSTSTDITGGMASKINNMLALLQSQPETKIQIFSGHKPDSIFSALSGDESGTVISST